MTITTISSHELILGIKDSILGSLVLNGSISGTVTIQPQAAAGTYDFNLPTTAGAAGQLLTSQGGGSNAMTWTYAGAGTVTSVSLADTSTNPIYTITNSPVTSSGTIDFALNTQTANTVFAGPTSGSAATPTFRNLVPADVPITGLVIGDGTTITSTGAGTSASPYILTSVAGAIPSINSQTGVLTIQSSGSSLVITEPSSGVINIESAVSGGSVTSVTFTGDGTVLSSTPSSAVTTFGTVTASLKTQSAGTFLAGPVSGPSANPTFRSLVSTDIPALTSFTLYGTTSGAITIQPQAVTGTYNFNLPITPGTAGYVLQSQGPSSAMTWFDAAALTEAQTYIGTQSVSVVALTSSSNVTAIDFFLSNDYSATLTENTLFANPTNAVAGTAGQIAIINGSVPYTVSFGSHFKFPGGTVPTVTATSGATDVLVYYVVSPTFITGALLKGFA